MFYEYWGFDEWSTIATIGFFIFFLLICLLHPNQRMLSQNLLR